MIERDQPAVAAAVIVQGARVLLVQRAVPEGSLLWQFPAGKIESGESAEDAAEREAAEETGLTVAAKAQLGERVHPETGRKMVYVTCEIVDGEAHATDAREIAAVAWSTLQELPGYVPGGFFDPVQRHLDQSLVG